MASTESQEIQGFQGYALLPSGQSYTELNVRAEQNDAAEGIRYDTTVELDRVLQAAADAAREEGFIETERGQAMKMLSPKSFVYVPKAIRQGEKNPQKLWADVTTCVNSSFRDFPAAQVFYPLGQYQWSSLIFDWAFDAALDAIDILSDANMCACLWIDTTYGIVPFKIKVAYVGLTVISLGLEMIFAGKEVYDNDLTWLADVKKRHGGLSFYIQYAKMTLLRYFAVPHQLLNAGFFYKSKDSGGRDANANGKFPVCSYPNICGAEYTERRNFVSKLPKVVIEDMLLFALTVYIVWHYLERVTFGAIASGAMSMVSLLKSTTKFTKFVSATRAYSKNLSAEVELGMKGADGALEKLMANPVRRCLTAC